MTGGEILNLAQSTAKVSHYIRSHSQSVWAELALNITLPHPPPLPSLGCSIHLLLSVMAPSQPLSGWEIYFPKTRQEVILELPLPYPVGHQGLSVIPCGAEVILFHLAPTATSLAFLSFLRVLYGLFPSLGCSFHSLTGCPPLSEFPTKSHRLGWRGLLSPSSLHLPPPAPYCITQVSLTFLHTV